MGTNSVVYLPDGQKQWLPISPRTWVDAGPTTPGDPLRARTLTTDASGGVMWHRQRPIYQGAPFLAQSIPTGVWTAVTGHTELIDNYGGHSDTTNTGRYYAPNTASCTTGGDWYLCTGYTPYNSNDPAHVYIAGLRTNGAGTVLEGGKVPGGAGHVVDTMVIDLVQMNGGDPDFIELMAFQNSGSAANTVVSGKSPSLTVRWVAADPAWSGFATPALPAVPHTWTGTDTYTGSATGSGKVPLNTELRDAVRYLNNPPIARLTSVGTSQTIPSGSGTWTSIQFPSESVDTYGGHDNVTSNTRYTAQRAGLYLVAGCASISEGDGGSTNTGYRAVRLLQTFAAGGSLPYSGWTTLPMTGTGSTGTAIWATGLLRMAAGDYVELQMQTTQGSTTTTRAVNSGAGNCSKLIAVWMAA